MRNRSKVLTVAALVIFAGVAASAAEPSVPFTLSEQEQATLDETLLKWQEASAEISASSCTYTRWTYDLTFGPKDCHFLLSRGEGDLKFRATDHLSFRETKRETFDGQLGKYVACSGILDHVACDGKNFYSANSAGKYDFVPCNIDLGWLGRALLSVVLNDGPCSVIRPIDGDTLKNSNWIREIAPPKDSSEHVWLELWPKESQRAADIKKTTVVLSRASFAPFALQILKSGGSDRTEYLFENWKSNAEATGIDADFTPVVVEKH